MYGNGVIQAAIDAGTLPAILVCAGCFIWLSCRGIADVILARQGKSRPPSRAAPGSTTLLHLCFLAAALTAAGVPILT